MARHSGPLHLSVEDISDQLAVPARVESRSKSLSESGPVDSSLLFKESVENLSRRPSSSKSTHELIKSSKNPDRNVRIARNHCNIQKNNPERAPAALPKKSPRKHIQNNSVGPCVVRKSGRATKQLKRFGIAKIQCSVCGRSMNRSFWHDEEFEFFNEPIACSFKCSQFVACIQKPIQ